MRVIPLAEHDSYYCLDDVEIWEVFFTPSASSFSSAELGADSVGVASPVTDNESDPRTGITGTSVSITDPRSSRTTSKALRNVKGVEMISWGNIPVVKALLLDEVVEIKQDQHGEGTGCYLWASSVILSRFILSDEFDKRILSILPPIPVNKDGSTGRKTVTVVDLGTFHYFPTVFQLPLSCLLPSPPLPLPSPLITY